MDIKAEWIDPVAATYRGRAIHVPPPPCEAFQYLLTLRILEGFDLAGMPRNGTDHIDTVLRAIRVAAGVRIATGVPSPAEARRAPVGRPCREPAGARARRQARRRADRAMDGARHRRPHHVVLDRRQGGQHGVRDAEPRQRVRLGRRRARHRRLPQQLPLLGRREPQEPQPRQAGRRHAGLRGALDRHPRTTSRCWRWARPAATASCRPRCRRWCSTSITACRCSRPSRRRARG